ncbi:MAG: GerAB/ArcD/ProY family transporter [Clostridia bacterium]|nr:GerAB/ArcD/ProY family transporter [Clostridia bacterium]
MSDINTKNFISFENRSFYFVLINLLTFRIFSRLPSLFPKFSGSAAALSALFSGVIAFGVIFLISLSLKKHNSPNLADAAFAVFGKIGGLIVCIISAFCLLLSATVTLGELCHLAKAISFPASPFWFVLLFFAVSAAWGASRGVDALARTHSIFVPVIVLGLIVLIVSTVFRGNLSNLVPIFGSGAEAVFGKGLSGTVMYTDLLVFFLLIPPKSKAPIPLKKILTASATGILLTCLFVLALNLSVSPSIISNDSFPFYLLMKEVYYGRFFQRIDSLMLLISSLSGMLYLSLNASAFSHVAGRIFNPHRQKLIPPFYIAGVSIFTLLANVLSSKIIGFLFFAFAFAGILLVIITLFFAKRRVPDENI